MPGIAESVDKLITVVSTEGVSTVLSDQKRMGMGYKALSGDIRGAAADFQKLGMMQKAGIVAGGALAVGGAGAAMLMASRQNLQAAMDAEQVQVRLRTGLSSLGAGADSTTQAILKQADALARLTGYDDEAITSSAGILASFPTMRGQIDQILPRLVDLDAGMRKLGKSGGKSMEDWALMLGKGLEVNPGMLRRAGINISKEVIAIKDPVLRTKKILEELDKEFGGQGAAFGSTGVGSVAKLNYAVGELQESMGGGLAKAVSAVATPLTGMILSLAKLNDNLKGVPGIAVAAVGGILAVSATVAPLGLLILKWKELRMEMNAVTVASGQAAVAQGSAATAGMGGGRFGGMLGKGLKGLGIGMGLGLAGAAVGALVADPAKKKLEESQGKSGAGGFTIGGIGSGALGGAGVGAAIGSIIPGVGTLIGGLAGAAVGAVGAAWSGSKEIKEMREGWKTAPKPGAQLDSGTRTAVATEQVVKLLEAQNKQIFGGGARSEKYVAQTLIERSIAKTLTNAVA